MNFGYLILVILGGARITGVHSVGKFVAVQVKQATSSLASVQVSQPWLTTVQVDNLSD